eukprot:TRINITY_DN60857_c0_g1_i1.p1 TRINITY_DN60857_c0_g1~~TRINITY_DN60857_c0_g1_i1.p1  ORF type:complete len:270 (-),score=73.64 TRINITY_DN60857_c0_g1_i1:93-902(-)
MAEAIRRYMAAGKAELSEELVGKLYKSRICKFLANGKHCHAEKFCIFAHSDEELRVSSFPPATEHQEEKKKKKLVRHEQPQGAVQAVAAAEPVQGTTLYMGNLSFNANEKRIRQFFDRGIGMIPKRGKKGKETSHVVAIRIATNPDGKPRGFAFVDLDSTDSAQKALGLDATNFQGRKVGISVSKEQRDNTGAEKPRSEHPPGGVTVFVKNLAYTVTEDDLWTAFEECGAMKAVRLFYDQESGSAKGMAYVEFEAVSYTHLTLPTKRIV